MSYFSVNWRTNKQQNHWVERLQIMYFLCFTLDNWYYPNSCRSVSQSILPRIQHFFEQQIHLCIRLIDCNRGYNIHRSLFRMLWSNQGECLHDLDGKPFGNCIISSGINTLICSSQACSLLSSFLSLLLELGDFY